MRAAWTEDEEEIMIQGKKTRLRALEYDDLRYFVQWVNDPEVRRLVAIRYPLSMTEEDQWWQAFQQRKNDHIFAIETEDGTYIGNIGLHSIEGENRQATLGIVIGPKDYWNQGYGTDAVLSMLNWAFGYLNLNRVYLRVYAYNRRAVRCYEKCGFQREGIMRQARYIDGQYHDEWMMGILRDEFVANSQEAP
jgi:RimJ/RimL family protein N-acetyltransferase